jgi:hypothetical protein
LIAITLGSSAAFWTKRSTLVAKDLAKEIAADAPPEASARHGRPGLEAELGPPQLCDLNRIREVEEARDRVDLLGLERESLAQMRQ